MSRAWWMRQSWPGAACGCCASWRWDGRRICPSLAAGLRHVGLCAPFRGVLCCSQTPFHCERFARKFADFRGHVTIIVNCRWARWKCTWHPGPGLQVGRRWMEVAKLNALSVLQLLAASYVTIVAHPPPIMVDITTPHLAQP